jgi:hypothetical protein
MAGKRRAGQTHRPARKPRSGIGSGNTDQAIRINRTAHLPRAGRGPSPTAQQRFQRAIWINSAKVVANCSIPSSKSPYLSRLPGGSSCCRPGLDYGRMSLEPQLEQLTFGHVVPPLSPSAEGRSPPILWLDPGLRVFLTQDGVTHDWPFRGVLCVPRWTA